MDAPPLAPRVKPRLRGVSHQLASVVAFAAGAALVLSLAPGSARATAVIYTLCLTAMLGFSAAYHRPHWAPRARARMERLDHAGIYLLIAGTYTPISLALSPTHGATLRAMVWGAALVGTLQSTFWMGSKVMSAVLYVIVGWSILPFLSEFWRTLDAPSLGLILGGGLVYSVGAVIYARRRPDPVPAIFGYHELFHAFVIVAASLHFAAVTRVLHRV